MSDSKFEPYAGMERDRDEAIRKFHNFSHDLPFFEKLNVYNPEGITADNLTSGTEDLRRHIAAGKESVVLSTRLVEDLGIEGTLQDTSFSRIAARSGQNSRHGVFFGKLVLGPTSVDIAIKSFPDEDGRADMAAAEELIKSHSVMNSGVRTFEPIGIGHYDDHTYTMWSLEPSTSTLDSIDWRHFAQNPQSNPGMIRLLSKTADEASAIHQRGWGHYDLHPKNVASDIAGKVFAIDWETAEIGGDVTDPETRYERARADIVTLATAFYNPTDHPYRPGIELFTGIDPEKSIEMFYLYFLNRYIARRIAANSGLKSDDIDQLSKEMRNLPDIVGIG